MAAGVTIEEAACALVRERWGNTLWLEGLTAYQDATTFDLEKWEPNVSGYLFGGDIYVFICMGITVLIFVYVFVYGDEGYTSGWSKVVGFNGPLPSVGLVICNSTFALCSLLYLPFKKLPSKTKPKQKRLVAVAKDRDAQKGDANKSDADVVSSSSSQPVPTPPPSPPADGTPLSRVTLARKYIVCDSKSKYVHVPLARMGDSAVEVVATVKLVDGVSARYGTEYSGVVQDARCVCDADTPRVAHLTLDKGARIAGIYVSLKDKPKLVPGDSGASEFTIALTGASSTSGGSVSVGPIISCVVRLVDSEDYPNGMRLSSTDEVLDPTAKPPPTGVFHSGKIKTTGLAAVAARRMNTKVLMAQAQAQAQAGADGSAEDAETTKPPTAPATDPVAPGITENVFADLKSNVNTAASTKEAPDGKRGKAMSGNLTAQNDIDNNRELFQLFWNWLIRCFRIKGLVHKVVVHQIAYVIIACGESLVQPIIYRTVIAQGLGNRSFYWTWICGLGYISWKLVRYHIKLNYFHGSMLVMQHMRCLLYTSPSPRDS